MKELHELGDQWIEKGRMYKAVAGSDCKGCSFGKMCVGMLAKLKEAIQQIVICIQPSNKPKTLGIGGRCES
nr:hypothetical protein [uncultured Sphaerochaeta sp.]